MAKFTPIPAVDIRGGRCVRLVQGDFSRETQYADDPTEMARHWQAEGAQRLHVVDLDGARGGGRANANAVPPLLRSGAWPAPGGGRVRPGAGTPRDPATSPGPGGGRAGGASRRPNP